MLTLPMLVTLLSIHFSAVVTPGPNFLLATQLALTQPRRAGLWAVRGIATGAASFVTAGFIGLAALLAQAPDLLLFIRLAGALYFAYFGWKMLRAGLAAAAPRKPQAGPAAALNAPLTPRQAYQRGLLTAIANPAALMYFFSLFTNFVPLGVSLPDKALIGALLVGITFGWYTLLVLTFARGWVQRLYRRAVRPMNALFGVLWLLLALRVSGIGLG